MSSYVGSTKTMVVFRQGSGKRPPHWKKGLGGGGFRKKEEVARVGEELRDMGLYVIS